MQLQAQLLPCILCPLIWCAGVASDSRLATAWTLFYSSQYSLGACTADTIDVNPAAQSVTFIALYTSFGTGYNFASVDLSPPFFRRQQPQSLLRGTNRGHNIRIARYLHIALSCFLTLSLLRPVSPYSNAWEAPLRKNRTNAIL